MDAALSSYAAMFISVSDKETISFKFLWFVQTKLITIFYTNVTGNKIFLENTEDFFSLT